MLVHGNDFPLEMPSGQVVFFEKLLKAQYEFKCAGVFASDAQVPQESVFLNRALKWDPAPAAWRSTPTLGTSATRRRTAPICPMWRAVLLEG